ncbi:MAG: hypothetical protein JJT75_05070, partial [Opitutales bacterium]|nr:hypothetical protein [Opitutales bacterium]
MNVTISKAPLLALILANLFPLIGVLFFDWDAGMVVIAYWFENLVIGFYTIGRIILASEPENNSRPSSPGGVTSMHLSKILMVPFFIVHFGGFCAVHGMFVLGMTGVLSGENDEAVSGIMGEGGILMVPQVVLTLLGELFAAAPQGLILLLIGLFVSHGISFIFNYVRRGEFRKTSPNAQMFAPYGRIVVIHVALIGAGFFIIQTGSPLPLVLLLIAGK